MRWDGGPIALAIGLAIVAACGEAQDTGSVPTVGDVATSDEVATTDTSDGEVAAAELVIRPDHPLAFWLGPDAAGTPGPNSFLGEADLPATGTMWRHDPSVTFEEATALAEVLGVDAPLVPLGDGRDGWHTTDPGDGGAHLLVENRPGLTFGYSAPIEGCEGQSPEEWGPRCEPTGEPVPDDVALAAGRAFVEQIGFVLDDVDVAVGHGGAGFVEVRATMRLGGVPSDFGWQLTVVEDGRVVNAHGPLRWPEPVSDVSLVSADEVIGRMNRIGIVGVAAQAPPTTVPGEEPSVGLPPTGLSTFDRVSLRLWQLPMLVGDSTWLIPGYRFENEHGFSGPFPAVTADAVTVTGPQPPPATSVVPGSGFVDPPPPSVTPPPGPPTVAPDPDDPPPTLPIPPADPDAILESEGPDALDWYGPALAGLLVGEPVNDAAARLNAAGWIVRTIDVDGPGDVTADERRDRVNLYHRDRVVVRLDVG